MKTSIPRIGGALSLAVWLGGCAMGGMGGNDGGWTTLVDGAQGMSNFHPVGEANWRGANGAIEADAGGKDPAYLVSNQSYTNFMLKVEFWASDDANSGVFLRCADPAVISDKSCYEANIFDQRPDPVYGTGAIVNVAKAPVPMPKAGGHWNTYDITVRGNRLAVVLNGVQTVDVEDTQHASGPIALQWGKGTIRFRKVQIKAI